MATSQSTKPVRFAVVGTGWAGIRHLEAAQEVGAWVDVVSVCDTDRAQLGEVARRFGIEKATPDYAEILADDSIDVVDICTPHNSHAELAIDAIAAGKHVLVEKPMASNLVDATKMIRHANRASLALGVAEHQVYDESTLSLRRILDGSQLGEIFLVIATWGFSNPGFSYPGRRAWLTDPKLGGTGTWMLQGIHRVAQLRALFGEADRVYAVESRTSSFSRGDIEGTVTAVLTMKSGFPVIVTQSSEMAAPESLKGITIFGDQGVCSLKGGRLTVNDGEGVVLHQERIALNPIQPYAREMESFARHILQGVDFPTSGEWELGSLAVIEAGYGSFRRESSISVAELIGSGDTLDRYIHI